MNKHFSQILSLLGATVLLGASAAFTGELLQRENCFKEDARGLAAFVRIEVSYKF